MKDPESALDHLKTIRSLMERATTYRTLCAPAAIVGGAAALVLGAVQLWAIKSGNLALAEGWGFAFGWLVVLVIAGSLNLVLLLKDSQARGEESPSPRMRHALGILSPPLLSSGLLGLGVLHLTGSTLGCAAVWLLGYASALHAANSFAPPTVKRVCLSSYLLGAAALAYWVFVGIDGAEAKAGPIAMMAGFGLPHLGFGIALKCCPPTEAQLEAQDPLEPSN